MCNRKISPYLHSSPVFYQKFSLVISLITTSVGWYFLNLDSIFLSLTKISTFLSPSLTSALDSVVGFFWPVSYDSVLDALSIWLVFVFFVSSLLCSTSSTVIFTHSISTPVLLLNTQKAWLLEDYARKISSSLLVSNYPNFSLSFNIYYLLAKTCRFNLGFLPFQIS